MNNKEHKKQLVIIAGVTGSIGQELLRHYLPDSNTLVYGLSRRGVSMDLFDKLPSHNLIVHVDMHSDANINKFIDKLPDDKFEKITYYHLLGEFKTEITEDLKIQVENDHDKDGINDEVYKLVGHAYKSMVSRINQISIQKSIPVNIVSYGSLADRHHIPCFQSFGKSREIVKSFSREMIRHNTQMNVYLFDTSTILAADEMLERPFIFATDVNPTYWITPLELVNRTISFISSEKGFVEKDIYLASPNFSDDYFDAEVTYVRRVKELYNKSV